MGSFLHALEKSDNLKAFDPAKLSVARAALRFVVGLESGTVIQEATKHEKMIQIARVELADLDRKIKAGNADPTLRRRRNAVAELLEDEEKNR